MPQTANSCHFYVRRGGYNPAFSLHTTKGESAVLADVENLIFELVELLPNTVTVERVEWQNPLGFVMQTWTIDEPGLLGNSYADFSDCTHITWASGGPESRSGCYIHPRPNSTYEDGSPTGAWAVLMGEFIALVVAQGWTDSEGSAITGAVRYRPSRRRRVRLAP